MGREVGDKVGAIIGAPPGSVSMHENVTTAAMVACSAIPLDRTRNRIVCLAADFPSTIYLYRAQEALGFQLTVVPAEPDLTVRLERVARSHRRTHRTRVAVACALQDVVHHGRRRRSWSARTTLGARVLLDGYQSAGIIPVDVAALGVDFFVGGCLKWLCGGPGTAFLYTRPDVRATLPPRFTGWFAHASPFAFDIGPLPRRETMRCG